MNVRTSRRTQLPQAGDRPKQSEGGSVPRPPTPFCAHIPGVEIGGTVVMAEAFAPAYRTSDRGLTMAMMGRIGHGRKLRVLAAGGSLGLGYKRSIESI